MEPEPEYPPERQALIALYTTHNPKKIADVDALLAEWAGDEPELLRNAQAKYLGEDAAASAQADAREILAAAEAMAAQGVLAASAAVGKTFKAGRATNGSHDPLLRVFCTFLEYMIALLKGG